MAVAACLCEQLNIFVHHNECERSNQDMREATLQHLLSLDQSFYDRHSPSSLRAQMRWDCINNQITWNLP